MTLCHAPPARKPARHSLRRLVVANTALLLIVVGSTDNAFALVNCGSKAVSRAAATQCRGYHPRAGAHQHARTRKIVKATAGPAEGEELTPANPPTAEPTSAGFGLADVLLPAATLVHRLARVGGGPSPWRARGAPAGNRWPASADAPTSTRATTLKDIVHGGAMPAVPAPAAWALLLIGALGAGVLIRPRRVARIQSWAATSPSRPVASPARAKASRSALDRVDPERYARAEIRRRGNFVRASASNRFGADR